MVTDGDSRLTAVASRLVILGRSKERSDAA